MTSEELQKLTDIIVLSAQYPSDFGLRALSQQVQRYLQNQRGTGNRFQPVKNSGGGILEPKAKSISEIIEEKRPTLMEAKELNAQIKSEEEADPKPKRRFKKSNSYKSEEDAEN
jgi:hypothetical protein